MFSPIVSVHRWLDLWIRNCRYSGAAELTSATTWMNLQNMMLSERSQTPKTVHGRTPWIWNLQEFPLWCSRLRSWHATDWSWSQLRSDSWLGNFHKPWVWPKREKKLSRNSKCIETENEFVATGENGDWLQTGTRALWGIVEIFFFLSMAAPVAYRSSRVRGRSEAASHSHSQSNTRSNPHLWPTPQLVATRDP